MLPFPTEQILYSFGVSLLASANVRPLQWVRCEEKPATRDLIRQNCPTVPGVYGMVGVGRELLYIGESQCLRDRLLSYFTGEPVSAKVRRMCQEACYLVWETTGHAFTAWLRELELIRRWQPRYNARGKPGRTRRSYVCVDRGPGGHVHLSRAPGDGLNFGPVPSGRLFRRSVQRVNDSFALCDCELRGSWRLSSQKALFAEQHTAECIRGAVGTCSAPCSLPQTERTYQDRLRSAVEFLEGRDVSVLKTLCNEMQAAARSRKYELAARLRDQHADLQRLATYLLRLREARGYSFLYPARGTENCYFIRGGQVQAVKAMRGSPEETVEFVHALNEIFPGDSAAPLVGPEDLDVVLLVSRWFHEHPDELKTVLSPENVRKKFANLVPRP
jgi:excinuclease ABC subunit C